VIFTIGRLYISSFQSFGKNPYYSQFPGFFSFLFFPFEFLYQFCKLGELVNHQQEDLAKFGYRSDRKVDFVFFETPVGDMPEPRV
jgi:hypothetical protein